MAFCKVQFGDAASLVYLAPSRPRCPTVHVSGGARALFPLSTQPLLF